MAQQLRFTYEPDPSDGTGQLFVSTKQNGLDAYGAAWFNTTEVIEFGNKLCGLGSTNPQRSQNLEGGFWRSGAEHVLEEVHLRLTFQVRNAESVDFRAVLAGDSIAKRDRVDLSKELSLEDVRAFGASLVAVAQGEVKEVVLP